MSGDSPDAQALREKLQEQRIADADKSHREDVLANVLDSIKNIPHQPEDLDKAVEKSINMHWASDTLTVKDVMEHLGTLSEEEYAAVVTPAFTQAELDYADETAANEAAYQKQMSQWDELSDAVGGDLFDDPEKLQAMRRMDALMGDDSSWDAFRAAVVAEVERVGTLSFEERDALWQVDRENLIERTTARIEKSGGEVTDAQKEEMIAGVVESWEESNPRPREQALETDLSM